MVGKYSVKNQLAYFIEWEPDIAVIIRLSSRLLTLFSNSTAYDSSYPWIRLTFMHLMGFRPVHTYCWKKVWTSHLPSPTYNVIICQLFFALKRFIFQLQLQLCKVFFRRVRYDVLAFKNKHSVLSAKCLRKKYNKGCHHVWMSGRFGALRLLKQRC